MPCLERVASGTGPIPLPVHRVLLGEHGIPLVEVMNLESLDMIVDGRRVVVDTGVGNAKTRANPAGHDLDTPYLDELTAAGFPPDDVDLVVLTHLHTDHVGWNTRREDDGWVPTFPNARYVTSDVEWAYWRSVELGDERARMFDDSILPIRDAGLLDTVDVGPEACEIAPGLRLLPAPGHTPGQVVVALRDGEDEAVISGDAVHHPLQISRPELTTGADVDPATTVSTRRSLLARLAARRTLLLGTHFTHPVAGRVREEAGGYRFAPETAS